MQLKKPIEYLLNLSLRYDIHKKEHGNRIWMLLSPQYLNYGDHLIAKAELDFIRKRASVIDVNYSYFEFWGDTLTNNIKKGDVIWITGGGFIGDLWPDSHAAVERIIRLFPNNRIILGPQTVYFDDIGSQSARQFVDLVHEHEDMVIFTREMNSMNLLQSMQIEAVLAPDFALFTDYIPSCKYKPKYVSFCMREDHERCVNDDEMEALKTSLLSYGRPFHNIIMSVTHCEIPTWLRNQFITIKMNEFGRSRLVITDRLHAMIMCCILGVPCVALDNRSKKISGVYSWLVDLPYIAFAESIVDVKSAANMVMRFHDCKVNQEDYHRLRKQLLEQYEYIFSQYIA